ncbi:MAG: GYD domain-containing protein [Chloroflexi bacterium]|nr:GYD domain-containing protein [Chloroflexota bacterium]
MTIYIQLLTLTPEGRERVYHHPESLSQIQESIHITGVQLLGQYAVLGTYDYVNIVQAQDNETIALFSLHLGVKVGAYVTTLPTIPLSRFEEREEQELPALEAGVQIHGEGGGA